MKKIVLAHGLPGSGKTTLMKRLVKESGDNAQFLNVDKYRKCDNAQALHNAADECMYSIRRANNLVRNSDDLFRETTVVYIDALLLTNFGISEFIVDVVKYFTTYWRNYNEYEFTILDFNEDREMCLKNNRPRALANEERDAAVTIRNASFQPLDLDAITKAVADKIANDKNIKGNTSVTVKSESHKVWNYDSATTLEKAKAFVYSVAYDCGYVRDNMFIGESWTIGGREWSYTGSEWNVGSDKPEDFESFDHLLTGICPNISFLNYKKIHKECCDVEEYYENDYYSSYTKNRWVCDLDKLAYMLIELDLIN